MTRNKLTMFICFASLHIAGCHTMRVVHGSEVSSTQELVTVMDVSRTSYHGYKKTGRTKVSNLCKDQDWSEVTIQRSAQQVASGAFFNAVFGLGSMATLGLGVMACALPAPQVITIPICAVGVGGVIYGGGLIASIPFNHTGFDTDIDVKWSCIQ